MLTPYAETIPRSFRLVMMPGPHIVITATDHDQERRSSTPCGPDESGFSCGAVSQEWEGGAGGVLELAGVDRLLRNARSTEIVCADDAGGRAHSDHDFMAS